MKIYLLSHLIKYYFPWLIPIVRKSKLLLKRGKIDIPIKANARYCYSVWLRHLSILKESNLSTSPSIVAELGPGDSIGVGLMSLLTGAKKYYAFDVVRHTIPEQNVELLYELVDLIKNQADIPNEKEFPRMFPLLKSYNFPRNILTKDKIEISNKMIEKIKGSLLNNEKLDDRLSFINYSCPWNDPNVITRESIDMIYSQAVLEHVNDLYHTYKTMYVWLKKGGVMSHRIDFKSHGTSKAWNGHWTYSDFEWKLINGKKTYTINRQPLSKHIDLLKETGFKIISVIPNKTYPTERFSGSINRNELSKNFKGMSDQDFTTCGVYIISIKV